ncbi:MAG: patatin-like phospholipase family protein [Chloroflexi bacterium]|nr:patatin-like phospholipase family protein [Chloroflexota bacterium]
MRFRSDLKVGLALGGGGARGSLHVVVLAELERLGIPVSYVAGVSAGALAGALYCSGLPMPALRSFAAKSVWKDFARLRPGRLGLLDFYPLEEMVRRAIGDRTFAEMPIPFQVVVTDLLTQKPLVVNSGRVAPAVRASCSVPLIVKPMCVGDRLLADGGASNNLPISVARAMGADIVIAVNLFSPIPGEPRGPAGIALRALNSLIRGSGDAEESADILISPDMSRISFVRMRNLEPVTRLGKSAVSVAAEALQRLLEEISDEKDSRSPRGKSRQGPILHFTTIQ